MYIFIIAYYSVCTQKKRIVNETKNAVHSTTMTCKYNEKTKDYVHPNCCKTTAVQLTTTVVKFSQHCDIKYYVFCYYQQINYIE